MHPDALEELTYSERCAETLRAELRADHFDPWADEHFYEEDGVEPLAAMPEWKPVVMEDAPF